MHIFIVVKDFGVIEVTKTGKNAKAIGKIKDVYKI